MFVLKTLYMVQSRIPNNFRHSSRIPLGGGEGSFDYLGGGGIQQFGVPHTNWIPQLDETLVH